MTTKQKAMNALSSGDIKDAKHESQEMDDERPRKKMKKHTGKKGLSPEVLDVRRRIQQCCANNDLATAMETYDQAQIDKVAIEAQSFYNLLNLCDGLGDRGVHIGTPKTSKSEERPTKVRTVDAAT